MTTPREVPDSENKPTLRQVATGILLSAAVGSVPVAQMSELATGLLIKTAEIVPTMVKKIATEFPED